MSKRSNAEKLKQIKNTLKTFKDFPRPGISFVKYLLLFTSEEHNLFISSLLDLLKEHLEKLDTRIDYIVGVELRGCLFGVPLALQMNKPFVPVRKVGKLPGEVVTQSYGTEYSKDAMSMQKSSLKPNSNVIIIDDLLATGGTLEASTSIVEKLQSNVIEYVVIIELTELNGSKHLKHPVFSLLQWGPD